MALKDILVHVDSSPQSEKRVNAAINLAAAHQAHLIGLYVLTYPYIPGYIRPKIVPEVLEHQLEAVRQAATKAETDFTDMIARAGINAEWRCVEGDPVEVLDLHSRCVDVAVVGQHDSEETRTTSDSKMPDRLILSAGRPVLVIPNVGEYPVIGERIMVAWDASRFATRAVNDAIPMMSAAKHVRVIAVNSEGGREGQDEIPTADICLHLARHGIEAEAVHIFAHDGDEGDALLSRAADQGTDLLVMGAYGHARWREIVLGGVTRHMLQHMTMPVLMSH
jgi:nucleotide-binding universal stress UspA family protein